MKIFKSLIPAIVIVCFSIQTAFSQDISREDKKAIKSKEQEIRVNEEMLLSGVEGLERIKSRLTKDKSKNRITKEEVLRKETIIRNVEARLSKLDKKIKTQKEELNSFKKSLNVKVAEVKEIETTETKTEKTPVVDTKADSDLATREQELKAAREKLEKEIKASEEAYQKQLEALRKKNEKLTQLDSQLKAEKKEIEDKISKEKRMKIMEVEDDISVNEEMLISGRQGLKKKKDQLETAKKEGALTAEDIQRKEAIISRVEKRLNKLENEIKIKKEELSKLKAA
ncbi:hypothetical protein [Tenacibaculum jejuense]|uniref:Uncharacterized protein n=1 Tax=Tenacibaculum jejuense TaxID=584609 RepID=A0A238U6Z9_9FLAO|nr:hypothetical protein [Tenacibaculum jejuense]SNR14368.1 protein of unknown function precursor [Tenacibaculum jejuense]